MPQNGQRHFKNFAWSVFDHFGTLWIKGLQCNIYVFAKFSDIFKINIWKRKFLYRNTLIFDKCHWVTTVPKKLDQDNQSFLVYQQEKMDS